MRKSNSSVLYEEDSEGDFTMLTRRQRNLFELRVKMNEARIAKKKRLEPSQESGVIGELDANDLVMTKAFILHTQGAAEARHKKEAGQAGGGSGQSNSSALDEEDLAEGRVKMNEARKANQTAMVAEEPSQDSGGISKQKWLEERKRNIGELLGANDLGLMKAFMLLTREATETSYKKWEKDWDEIEADKSMMLVDDIWTEILEIAHIQ